jgi:hypothetical protein
MRRHCDPRIVASDIPPGTLFFWLQSEGGSTLVGVFQEEFAKKGTLQPERKPCIKPARHGRPIAVLACLHRAHRWRRVGVLLHLPGRLPVADEFPHLLGSLAHTPVSLPHSCLVTATAPSGKNRNPGKFALSARSPCIRPPGLCAMAQWGLEADADCGVSRFGVEELHLVSSRVWN